MFLVRLHLDIQKGSLIGANGLPLSGVLIVSVDRDIFVGHLVHEYSLLCLLSRYCMVYN